MVVGRVGELLVGDRQLEPVAEDLQFVLGQLLGLVGDVARLDAGAERPALHRLGQDHHRRAGVLHGRRVGPVDLAVVVAAAPQLGQLVVGEVLDQGAQARVGAEEVLADVGAVRHREALVVAVERLVHLRQQHAVLVACEQVVPLARPDHLDHVPAGAAEDGLELLDDLAVAAHRAVEPLQVAVDHEGQVVEPLAGRHGERAERLRLVHLPVAEEGPDAAAAGVGDAARGQVAVESRLVDGVHRSQAHAHRRELPELRHEAWVRVRGEPARPERLAPEVVELLAADPSLEEGARVDARRGVALEEDLVADPLVVPPAEEVVEADLVEAGRARRRSTGGRRSPRTDCWRAAPWPARSSGSCAGSGAPLPRRPGSPAPARERWC